MTKVINVTQEQLNKMKYFYQDNLRDNTNQYVFFAVKDAPVTAYTSGKVVFQGGKGLTEYEYWIEFFGMVDDIIEKDIIYYSSSIGSDEVGKGDYFGPLVVCAAYVSNQAMELVRDLGIQDSKKTTDERIIKVAKKIKDEVQYSVMVLNNKKYNDLKNKGYSVVKMMAILHNAAIYNLVHKVHKKVPVYIDQFAEPGVYYHYLKGEKNIYRGANFTTKAESKHSSVAVASILARYKYLAEMDRLSKEVGVVLPKGGGELVDKVIAKIIKEKGETFLYNIGKISFANTEKAKKLL